MNSNCRTIPKQFQNKKEPHLLCHAAIRRPFPAQNTDETCWSLISKIKQRFGVEFCGGLFKRTAVGVGNDDVIA
jgi:hypothetical protein